MARMGRAILLGLTVMLPLPRSGASEPTDREVARLMVQLRQPDRTARLGAINRLRRLAARAAPAVPVIATGLSDPDSVIRGKTARLLAQIGQPAAVAAPLLIAAVDDPNASVRDDAVLALAQIRPDPAAATPALVAYLRRDLRKSSPGSQTAMSTLAGFRPLPTREIVALIREAPPERKGELSQILGQAGETARPAIPALVEELSQTSGMAQNQVSWALSVLCASDPAPLLHALEDAKPGVRAGAAAALQQMGTQTARTVPALIAALERDPPPAPVDLGSWSGDDLWNEVFKQPPEGPAAALAGIGRPAIPAMLAQLDLSDRPHRIRAIRTLSLSSGSGRGAIPRLIGALARPDLRLEAIRALRRIQPPALAAMPKLTALLKHRDPEVRREAAYALGSIGRMGQNHLSHGLPSEPISGLAAALRDPDPSVRRAVALALGIGNAANSAIPDLVRCLDDHSKEVRVAVLSSLGQFAKIEEPAQARVARLLADPDRRVRLAAAGAVGIQSTLTAAMIDALLSALADPDPGLRAAAGNRLALCHGSEGFWAGDMNYLRGQEDTAALVANGRAYAVLRRLAAEAGDRRLRAPAVHLLPLFKDHVAESVPVLIARLNDTAIAVRVNAVVALANLGPAAAPALDSIERAVERIQGTHPLSTHLVQGLAKCLADLEPESRLKVLDRLALRLGRASVDLEVLTSVLGNSGVDACGAAARALVVPDTTPAGRQALLQVLLSTITGSGIDPAVDPRFVSLKAAEPVLQKLADDADDTVSDAALTLLEALHPSPPSEARRILEDVAERGIRPWLVNVDRLTLQKESELDVLLAALHAPRADARAVAVTALLVGATNLQPEQHQPIRRRILDAVIPLLDDPDPEIRGAVTRSVSNLATGQPGYAAKIAAKLIVVMKDRTSRCHGMDWIERMQEPEMTSDPLGGGRNASGSLRYEALLAIGVLGEGAAEAVPSLIEALREDDLLTRYLALQSLAQVSRKAGAAVPVLIRLAESGALGPGESPDAARNPQFTRLQFRYQAVNVLGQVGPGAREAVPLLIRMLRAEDAGLVTSAESALSQIGAVTPEVVPALVQTMNSSPDGNIVSLAANSLRILGEPGVAALLEALRSPDPEIRFIVAANLGNTPFQANTVGSMGGLGTRTLKALDEAAQHDPDPQVADMAANSARQIRDQQKAAEKNDDGPAP